MKNLLFILNTFFFLSCTAQQTVDNRVKEIVFRNVNVITMDKNEVLPGQDVVTKNGVIAAIGPTSKIKYSKEALVIDAKGK